MAFRRVFSRFQGWIRQQQLTSLRVPDRSRRPPPRQNHNNNGRDQRETTTGLDIARFGLLSIATLPFSLWVAIFSYDYVYRVSLCQDALTEEDSEIAYIRSKTKDEQPCIGRTNQLAEVRALLSSAPHQIIVVAGTNESGKSRFVSEVLRDISPSRGVTYIQLAQMVDSLSTLTHALVRSFDLRWLQMRHSLIDVLPFAGSEILVMKERFSDRDLAQALLVVTEALTSKAASDKNPNRQPVIVIDGLGNEELVISLTDQNRTTRGHVKVIGLGDLTLEEAGKIVLQEIPDAKEIEVKKITEAFGGFIHDVQAVSREIQSRLNQGKNGKDASTREKIVEDVLSRRFRLQVERVTAAFSKGMGEREDTHNDRSTSENDGEDLDPYLDPLKAIYSEAQASQSNSAEEGPENSTKKCVSWTQLQLWHTLQRLVESENMTVPFADLRDDVFEGDITPLLELMNEDVLGFEVESSSESGWSWEVKPATPALGRVFQFLVMNSHLKERFQEIQSVAEARAKLKDLEDQRRRLRHERRRMDMRKASLLRTVELGRELKILPERTAHQNLEKIYNTIVSEEIANELRGIELRKELRSLALMPDLPEISSATQNDADTVKEPHQAVPSSSDHSSIQQQLRRAILETYVQEGSKDKFQRFRDAYEQLAASRGGMSASDVVKLIKATSGEDVDLEAAEAFIRAWDVNDDKRLNYEEFTAMLLTDPKVVRNAKKTIKT